MKIIKECLVCEDKFKVFPYRRKTVKFCSRKCSDIYKIGTIFSVEHKTKISEGIKKHLPKTAYKIGERPSIKTEFKKGCNPWNKEKSFPEKRSQGNHNWKGNKVSVDGLHKWVVRHKGKPKICEKCGKKRFVQWSNKDHKYKRSLIDFHSLCSSCHKIYDIQHNKTHIPFRNSKGQFVASTV